MKTGKFLVGAGLLAFTVLNGIPFDEFVGVPVGVLMIADAFD